MVPVKDHGLATVVWTRKAVVSILTFCVVVVLFVFDSLLTMIDLVLHLHIFQGRLEVVLCGRVGVTWGLYWHPG